jgi:2-(1,2-epoxy-1,2-dihydrophenyl)acetyl-CoA isomerase
MTAAADDGRQVTQELADLVLRTDGHVAHLVLNRPQRLNAIDVGLVETFHATLAQLRGRSDLSAVTLTGAGRAFCAGADVKSMAGRPARHLLEGDELERARSEERRRLRRAFSVTVGLAELPQATVAGLHGSVAGAGIALALACDWRVAAESTVFVPGFAQLALPGDWGISWLARRKVGEAAARRLLLAGERIDADEALRVGMVDQVVPDEDLHGALAQQLAAFSDAAPTAIAAAKGLLRPRGLRRAIRREIAATLGCQETPAHATAVADFRLRNGPGPRNRVNERTDR